MTKAKGLGKGLGALMGDVSLQSQEGGSVTLPIAQIEPGLNQPRKHFDADSLADLADSIREHGILQPLTVRRLSSGYYQIIAGERRWRAAKQAGLEQVPALIIEADDRKVMELGLIENLQREDLNPVEEALGYETLIQEYGLTQESVAQRMGKSRPAIANALRLLPLPPAARKLLEEGKLSAGHARAVLAAPEALREDFAARIVEEGLSVRQAEQMAKKLAEGRKEKPKSAAPARQNALYLQEAAKSLSGRLGRRVRILPGRKKGRVELEYYNEQDLEALLDLLTRQGGGAL